ncbi:MAG: protoporphyrinogen oxidase [Actinomycetes bacterium]
MPTREPAPAPGVRHVVVVGGGIAGLAAAWFLRRDLGTRVRVTVLEGAPTIGGKLATSSVSRLTVDVGAEAMLARRPEGVDLVRAVGLGDELEPARTASAGVWSRGALRRLPEGQVMGVPSDLRALAVSRVLSPRGLARAPLDLLLRRTPVEEDLSVAAHVGARMGREVVERLVEPLLGGVYAGHADALSFEATVPQLAAAVRRDRTLLAAARRVRASSAGSAGPVFVGLPGGLGRLPGAVATASGAEVRTGATVRRLCRDGQGWQLVLGPTRAPEPLEADAVVLAVPARPAARLLAEVAPAASTELGGIDYASTALVTLALDRAGLPRVPEGSGFLVPPVENRLVKGVTLSSEKWGWLREADPGLLVLRASVGRYGEEADLQRDDDDLVAAVTADLADLVGLRGRPRAALVTRWGGGLPQYAVGHRARVARALAAVADAPGLAVCGAAYEGVGIPACVATAEAAARRVGRYLGDGLPPGERH